MKESGSNDEIAPGEIAYIAKTTSHKIKTARHSPNLPEKVAIYQTCNHSQNRSERKAMQIGRLLKEAREEK